MIIDYTFFEDEYYTLRKLSTDVSIYREYSLTWKHINSIQPKKNHVFFSQLKNNSLTNSWHFDIIEQNNNLEWPCIIKYPEQILGVDEIYIVSISSNKVLVDYEEYGNIEVVRIENPVVISPDMIAKDGIFPYFTTIDEYREMESSESWHQHMLISKDSATKQSLTRHHGRCIPFLHLNLLPSSPRTYNAVFYNEDVANLYAETIRELYRLQ
jgi:hypothetical protein